MLERVHVAVGFFFFRHVLAKRLASGRFEGSQAASAGCLLDEVD